MTSIARIVNVVAILLMVNGSTHGVIENIEMTASRYLRRYGYLQSSTSTSSAPKSDGQSLRHAIGLFQEYYHLPHDQELNEETLFQMRKPRCGVKDISDHGTEPIIRRWPRTNLTWNFHLASSEHYLSLTQRAFDLWAANTSLTFKRDTSNPDIVISFQMNKHVNINSQKNGDVCYESFDGPGMILAHALLPNGWNDFVSEIHLDKAEPWHVYVNVHPRNTLSLLHTLTHEIGHSLGLLHNQHNDSIMYAFSPDNPIPVRLSKDDVFNIEQLYRDGNDDVVETTTSTSMTSTMITTMTTTTASPVSSDLCTLRQIDALLITNKRMYIAHERHVWSVDVNGKTFNNPLLLTNYMKFIPHNFTRLRGAYQNPSGDILLFVDHKVYKVRYPSFDLVPSWPRTLDDFGLPPKARINAALNTNTGRSLIIYNDRIVGEIDECHEIVAKHYNIETLFPGLPSNVRSAFRFLDGNLYFLNKRQFYKFNEYTETITEIGDFDLRIINIVCPRDGLLRQLRDLLDRFVRINADDSRSEKEDT